MSLRHASVLPTSERFVTYYSSNVDRRGRIGALTVQTDAKTTGSLTDEQRSSSVGRTHL